MSGIVAPTTGEQSVQEATRHWSDAPHARPQAAPGPTHRDEARFDAADGTVWPAVSVVVPTFHRPELLARCIGALARQTLAREDFEVLVVDDGRSDATRDWVAHEATRHPHGFLRYLRPALGKGPAAARNWGWRAARAELVAFTDDDTLPAPDWLAQGRDAMRRNGWSAMAGRVVVPAPPDRAADGPTDHELMTRGLETSEFVTANAFVLKSALARVKGFDERFTRAWREDSDLQFRLEDAGAAMGRCDTAVVCHPVRPERWGVSLWQQKNVYFDALLYRKHPRRYRARVRARPPWDYYAIVGLTALAPVLMARGIHGSAIVSGLVALGLVLRLAARRLRTTSRTPAHVAEMVLTSLLIPFLSVYWRLRGAWRFRVWFL